uniref:Uncharacterized protein n=1 Tax=Anguilla anguilla TaxID=7936 RepID=A0A0E9RYX2_ANGAN
MRSPAFTGILFIAYVTATCMCSGS